MVPAHYKCTDASRNLTGYMSRPPMAIDLHDGGPLAIAPPPRREATSSSSSSLAGPLTTAVVYVLPEPDDSISPFNVWGGKMPPPKPTTRTYVQGPWMGKASSPGYKKG